ncbi:hypothetical protein CLU79DRAFT_877425 [Phycomyces nitens]|nr:hypothetical protein CLU79DRAFT_877425 [Phycomyces nitens]
MLSMLYQDCDGLPAFQSRSASKKASLGDEEKSHGLLEDMELQETSKRLSTGSDVDIRPDMADLGSSSRSFHHRSHQRQKSRAQDGQYERLGQESDGPNHPLGSSSHPRRSSTETNDPGDESHVQPEIEISNPIKRSLYLLLEDPSSSNAAFWTNVVVSVLIVFSAVTTTIETIPAFRFNVESAMVALFSLEYILRIFAHSDSLGMLRRFFLSPISIIDFISIVPFYIELLAKRDTSKQKNIIISGGNINLLRANKTYEFRFTILRLFRLLRLFKTYKYSSSLVMTLEVMMIALRRSGDALSALFFFLVTSVVLFSTLLYFAERGVWDEALETFVTPDGNPSAFDSIPAAFWFVVVTITTTGYGDMVPATFIGKLITFPAMMFGVLLITLPSIIVGRNFTIVWETMRRHQYLAELANSSPDPAGPDTPNEGEQDHRQSSDRRRSSMLEETFAQLPAHTSGFGLLNTGNEAVMDQLQTLITLTQQNQEAIQQIFKLLEKQQNNHQNYSHQPAKRVSFDIQSVPENEHRPSDE